MDYSMALILIEIMEEYEPDYWGDKPSRGNGCGWILWLVVIWLGVIVKLVVMILRNGGAE